MNWGQSGRWLESQWRGAASGGMWLEKGLALSMRAHHSTETEPGAHCKLGAWPGVSTVLWAEALKDHSVSRSWVRCCYWQNYTSLGKSFPAWLHRGSLMSSKECTHRHFQALKHQRKQVTMRQQRADFDTLLGQHVLESRTLVYEIFKVIINTVI